MAHILVTVAMVANWNAPSPDTPQSGLATYYRPGLMATVAANRGYIRYPGEYAHWLQATGYLGAVALNPAGDLDRTVWIERNGAIEGPYLSIDCAALHHYADRLAAQRIVETDYATAKRWGMAGVGPMPVTVHYLPPIDQGLLTAACGHSHTIGVPPCSNPRSSPCCNPVYHRFRSL